MSVSVLMCIVERARSLTAPVGCGQTTSLLSHATMSHATLSHATLRHATSSHACYAASSGMSQPRTVSYRGGQLDYPAWAAHTTPCRSHS